MCFFALIDKIMSVHDMIKANIPEKETSNLTMAPYPYSK